MTKGMTDTEIWLRLWLQSVSSLWLHLMSFIVGEASHHVVNVSTVEEYPMRNKLVYSELQLHHGSQSLSLEFGRNSKTEVRGVRERKGLKP